MIDIRMYCTTICRYCFQAERLLEAKGVAIRKIFIDTMHDGFGELLRLTGRRTVPQISSAIDMSVAMMIWWIWSIRGAGSVAGCHVVCSTTNPFPA